MNIAKLFPMVLAIIALCFNCSVDKPVSPQRGNQNDYLAMFSQYDIDNHSDRLESKYSYILSYPSGGGIFVLRSLLDPITPSVYPHDYAITLHAHPDLNAVLTSDFGNHSSRIHEITINPSPDIETRLYQIQVDVMQNGGLYRIPLEVDVINRWASDDSMAVVKRNEFLPWLETHNPEFGNLTDLEWQSYFTYPGILVVEHWTFLSKRYEVRVCWHVMIPPYDWSMFCIRERGQWKPSLALRRETDGRIHEIAVADYPQMYGY